MTFKEWIVRREYPDLIATADPKNEMDYDAWKLASPDDDYDEVPCDECGGSGSTECPECGGEPQPDCEDCHGSGTVDCRKCEGSGEMSVPRSRRRYSRRDDDDYDPRDDY